MHTRDATPSDFPDIASICVACFDDDELYNFTNPYKHIYPADFRHYFVRRFRARYWTPGFVIQVAVTDEGDNGHIDGGNVVGYSVWHRVGDGEEVQKYLWKGWMSYIERGLQYLEDSYIQYTGADRSLSPVKLEQWINAARDEIEGIPDMWKLRNLAVLPDFQRRGIGGLLMAWGKERAIKEQCPVGLSSSMRGQGLYLKQGFKRFAVIHVNGINLEDVPCFLWEPPGMEGKWSSGDEKVMVV